MPVALIVGGVGEGDWSYVSFTQKISGFQEYLPENFSWCKRGRGMLYVIANDGGCMYKAE
jgi:hypothetical protein